MVDRGLVDGGNAEVIKAPAQLSWLLLLLLFGSVMRMPKESYMKSIEPFDTCCRLTRAFHRLSQKIWPRWPSKIFKCGRYSDVSQLILGYFPREVRMALSDLH